MLTTRSDETSELPLSNSLVARKLDELATLLESQGANIFRNDHESHGQWTVITSRFGKLKGQRIVRGREDECAEYYQAHSPDKNTLFG